MNVHGGEPGSGCTSSLIFDDRLHGLAGVAIITLMYILRSCLSRMQRLRE
jgi:hypothetical protein